MAEGNVGALPLDASETSRRIRAAKNYRGDLSWSELAEVTGIGKPTLERMTRVVDPQPARPDQLDAIADATGVPRAFLRHGWTAIDLSLAWVEPRAATAARNELAHDRPVTYKSLNTTVMALQSEVRRLAAVIDWLLLHQQREAQLPVAPVDLDDELPGSEVG